MRRHKFLITFSCLLALLGLLVFSGCCPMKHRMKRKKVNCEMHKKSCCPSDKGCFICPMHPEEMKMEKGKCSICNMDLTPHKCGPKSKKGKMKNKGCPSQ